jgi:hypothetical protein
MRRTIIRTIVFLASAALAVGQTPNFEGIWNNSTLTPMERPAEFASKPVLTPQEAAAFAKRTIDSNNTDHRPTDADTDVVQGYNNFWWDLTNIRGSFHNSSSHAPASQWSAPKAPALVL